MTKKRPVFGTCCICGEHRKLSLEHVPNKAAFNSGSFVEYTIESTLRKVKVKGKKRQGGLGEYTLCRQCNSVTGSWYGDEFTKWAHASLDFLQIRTPSESNIDAGALTLISAHPLRFFKQVVTCFCSIIGPSLIGQYPALTNYLLHKTNTEFPSDLRVFMNFYYGPLPKLRRFPMAGKVTVKNVGRDLIPVASAIFSEFCHPPFQFIMTFGDKFQYSGEITHFSQYAYDEQKHTTLRLLVVNGTTSLPGSLV